LILTKPPYKSLAVGVGDGGVGVVDVGVGVVVGVVVVVFLSQDVVRTIIAAEARSVSFFIVKMFCVIK
jgi:hypothetical protein